MVGDIAAYAAALAVLTAAAGLTVLVFRVYRSLRRWDRMAIRLALKADTALDEYIRLAAEAREAAQLCRSTISGFARLADAARTVGDIADSAARTAANIASLWRGRTASAEEQNDPAAELDWAEIGRHVGYFIRRRIFGYAGDSSRPSHPETSADPTQGE